jgi:hypothetical protein
MAKLRAVTRRSTPTHSYDTLQMMRLYRTNRKNAPRGCPAIVAASWTSKEGGSAHWDSQMRNHRASKGRITDKQMVAAEQIKCRLRFWHCTDTALNRLSDHYPGFGLVPDTVLSE